MSVENVAGRHLSEYGVRVAGAKGLKLAVSVCCKRLFHRCFSFRFLPVHWDRKRNTASPVHRKERKNAAEGKASDSVFRWHGLACRSFPRRAGSHRWKTTPNMHTNGLERTNRRVFETTFQAKVTVFRLTTSALADRMGRPTGALSHSRQLSVRRERLQLPQTLTIVSQPPACSAGSCQPSSDGDSGSWESKLALAWSKLLVA